MLNPFRKATISAAAAVPNTYQAKCLEALKTVDGSLELVNRLDAEINSMSSPVNPRGRMWRRQREEASRVHGCLKARAEIVAAETAYRDAKRDAERLVKERAQAVESASQVTAAANAKLSAIVARTAPLIEATQQAKRTLEQQLQQAEEVAQATLEAAERAGDDVAANEASVALAKARERRTIACQVQSPEALRVETLQRHATQAKSELQTAQQTEADARADLAVAEYEQLTVEHDHLALQYLLSCARARAASKRLPNADRPRRHAGWADGQVIVHHQSMIPLNRATADTRLVRLMEMEKFDGPDASVFEVDPLTLPTHNSDAEAAAVAETEAQLAQLRLQAAG